MVSYAYASALALAAVLGFASASKLRSLTVFREQVADYRLVPYEATWIVAGIVVAAEALAAALLVVPTTRRVGAIVAAPLLALFLIALVSAWRRGRAITCACFGGRAELDTVGAHSVVRTTALLALALIAASPASSTVAPRSMLLAILLGLAVFEVAELVRLVGSVRRDAQAIAAMLAEPATADSEPLS